MCEKGAAKKMRPRRTCDGPWRGLTIIRWSCKPSRFASAICFLAVFSHARSWAGSDLRPPLFRGPVRSPHDDTKVQRVAFSASLAVGAHLPHGVGNELAALAGKSLADG